MVGGLRSGSATRHSPGVADTHTFVIVAGRAHPVVRHVRHEQTYQAQAKARQESWRAGFRKVDDDNNGVLDVDEFMKVRLAGAPPHAVRRACLTDPATLVALLWHRLWG